MEGQRGLAMAWGLYGAATKPGWCPICFHEVGSLGSLRRGHLWAGREMACLAKLCDDFVGFDFGLMMI